MEIAGYRILELIAKGGTSSVYLAIQESLQRTVALKVLDRLDEPGQSERFLAEGRIIAGLHHRNINTLYEVGRSGRHHYLAMAYLEGGSLAERIEKGMGLSQALDLLETMADCLGFLHSKGIVHRDVKPGNILYQADGTPKLTDFGIAKQLQSDQQHTLNGTALGSPYYLSPEQATSQPVDGRADIYSLGIVFYEMLTGRKPFSEDSHVQTIVAHLNQPVPKLPDTFALYQPLLDRMLAKDPNERFSSAVELLGYIRGLRLAHPEQELKFWQRPAFALGTVAALLMSVGLGAWLLLSPSQDNHTSPLPREAAVETTEAPAAPLPTPPAPEPPAVTVADEPPAAAVKPLVESPPTAPTATTMQPTASVSSPVADRQLDAWLVAARQARKNKRLSIPPEDSALYYYRKVLEQEPDNAEAQAGLHELVDRYRNMALTAKQQGKTVPARRYVQRGLNIDPKDAQLLALRDQLADTQGSQEPSPWDENVIDRSLNSAKSWWRRNFD